MNNLKRPKETCKFQLPETKGETKKKLDFINRKIIKREMEEGKIRIEGFWEIKRRLIAHYNSF